MSSSSISTVMCPGQEASAGGATVLHSGPLAKENADGLPDALAVDPAFQPHAGTWFVVHSKPRQEKALARNLDARDIPFFLPTLRKVRIYGHRRRIVDAPLFAGYLFLRGTLESTYDAIDSRRVVRVIPVKDQSRIDHELRQIRLALAGHAELDPYPFIQIGLRVRVRSGPFQGLEGMVDAKKKEDRIVLIVQTIGRATSLEIDASLLEPVD